MRGSATRRNVPLLVAAVLLLAAGCTSPPAVPTPVSPPHAGVTDFRSIFTYNEWTGQPSLQQRDIDVIYGCDGGGGPIWMYAGWVGAPPDHHYLFDYSPRPDWSIAVFNGYVNVADPGALSLADSLGGISGTFEEALPEGENLPGVNLAAGQCFTMLVVSFYQEDACPCGEEGSLYWPGAHHISYDVNW